MEGRFTSLCGLTALLALLLLTPGILTICGKGCLSCGADGYCKQCDTTSFFVLQNSTCVLSPVVGCNSTDLGGNCVLCSINYFLFNSSCFAVSETIANCVQYLSATACSGCASGFYLTGGTCQKQTAIIQYCQSYTSDGSTCTACINNYVLSFNGQACVSAPQVANCQSYTNLQCSQCTGTYINRLYAYSEYVGLITNSSGVYERNILLSLVKIGQQNTTASNFPTCLYVTVANCKVPLDYNTCSVCNDNYYLDDAKSCQPFPVTAVANCAVYLNDVTCTLCSTNFYLATNGSCLAVAEIQNCQNYSSTANNVCLQCTEKFYSTLDKCVARSASLSIQNCLSTDPFSDKCANCTALFTASNDGLSCVAATPNCASYSKTSLAITCSSCAQNYYLNQGNNCILSSASNCQIVSGLTTCSQCNPGFYLDSANTCQLHTLSTLQSCNTTSLTQLNGCNTCDPDKILAKIDGMCLKVGTTLSNCLVYQNPTTCQTCDPTVSYKLNGVCFSTYLPQCLLYAPDLINSCAQCRVDSTSIYIAFPPGVSNNNCVVGNPNVANNCQTLTNTNNIEGCSVCAPTYYPKFITSLNNAFCVPRTYYLLAGQSARIVNCLLYDHQAQTCIVCSPGLVIDLSGSCVTQCSSGGFLYSSTFETSNATDVSLTGRLKCLTTAPNYAAMNFNPSPFPCYFISSSTSGLLSLCGGCASNQVPVIDLSVTQVNTVNGNLWPITGLLSISYYNAVPSIQQCVPTQVTLTGSTSQLATLAVRSAANTPMTFDNCRFAIKVGTKYGCGACKFGFSGVPVADFDNTGYFIRACQAVSACQPNIYYSGIGSLAGQVTVTSPPLDFFVSCHYCQSGLIPTFARSATTIASITPPINAGYYGPFGLPTSADANAPYNNERSWLSVTSCQVGGFGLAFIAFCAIQELKIDARITAFSSALGAANNPLCQACLPGYSPSFITNTNIISGCNVISNCNFNVAKRFNLCDQCNANFALVYDVSAPDQLSFYQSCIAVANRDLNCIYANPTTFACVICKPGYFLNVDKVCDALNAWDCQVPGFLSPLSLLPYRTLAVLGTGCQQCSDTSILIRFSTGFKICALSVIVASNTVMANSNFLIQNCQNFGFDSNNSIVCYQCSTGHLPTASNTACFPITSALSNCLVLTNDGNTCYSCVNYFYATNGVCVKGSNQNCLTYVPGQLNSCQTCINGFIAMTINNSMSICVKNPTINCAAFVLHGPTLGQISCAQCEAGYYYETRAAVLGASPLSICLLIPPIANCISYMNTGSVLTATMACLKCSAKYYVLANACVLRVNVLVLNCDVLDPNADACLTCSTGYWLDSQKTCKPFPTGISGCIVYKSAIACTQCDKNLFLSNNKCVAVPAANLVPNCIYYDSNMNCQSCNSGFFLRGLQSCVAVQATNCATYVDPTNCATCLPNFGLSKSTSATNCVSINIPNCMTPDNTTLSPNFQCKVCQTSFFLNSNGGCTAVPTNIPFCYLYSSATTCSTCFSGYVLTPLKTSCVINTYLRNVLDPNCQYSVLLSSPICNACKPGFTLQMGSDGSSSCVQCNAGSNCLVCQSNALTKCLACDAGFSQDETGSCSKTFQAVRSLGVADRVLATLLAILFGLTTYGL